MIKYFILFLVFFNSIFAQSQLDIKKLSNDQLNTIKNQLSKTELNQKNLNGDNLDFDKQKSLNEVSIEPKKVISPIKGFEDYFGYEYFYNDINFFDNIPTPRDFKLGPGDEVVISLWGQTNSRETFIVNKEGLIYYKNLGFINVSNQTLKDAELLLKNELSKIYSSLNDKDNGTNIMLELGQLKSINIYLTGSINKPGIHLVHPFSDIFSALVNGGGININGSLRNVQIIRNSQIITTIDFYSFFNKGSNSFSNIRLIDGDTIHVPVVKNRIKIEGEVVRPGYYEILDNEKVANAIDYAAGLKAKASSFITIDTIIPAINRSSDDNAISSININLKDYESISLNNGDLITVREIGKVASKVEIFGRVKTPGKYSAINASLRDILDIAGGFDDPIFRKTIRLDEIIILRQDPNQFYSIEIPVTYDDADKFKLQPNDKIFIYEDINYRNSFTYRVEGEVNKPGTYVFSEGLTVGKAIEIAQGLTTLASKDNVVVFQEYTELNEDEEEITLTLNVANVKEDFVLGSNSVVKVFPFENVVRVEGNVYNPGLVAYDRGLTMSQAIEQAGGYKPYSMKKRTYVKKANGEIDKANIFRGRTKRLSPGDTVIVPLNPDPSDFDITTFVADLSTTLANIAAILLIVDNQTN